ncbi:hypothetical protein C8J57DRAFT_1222716 [Mycena rebaudengoi]|nr:hypothetical protein C8J57DRAFT_1222716 [Mycena rebaudengoi]
MQSFFTATFLLGLLTHFALAVPVENDETVLTPFGYRLKSQVHELPAGGGVAQVGNEIHLLAENGTVLHVVSPSNVTLHRKGNLAQQRDLPISFFQSTWPVPPAPATQRGQSIILFKDLENAAANVVISSVLQYGVTAGGGGAFWGVSHWYQAAAGILTFVQPIPVNPGTVLTNVISLTANNNPNFNYQLTRVTIGLEAHGVVAKSDYPATASTQITQINVQLTSTPSPSLAWSVVNDAAHDITTAVNVNGPFAGKITIKYQLIDSRHMQIHAIHFLMA